MRIPLFFLTPDMVTPDENKPILVYQEALKKINRFVVGYYKDGEYHTNTGEALIEKSRILGWSYLLEPNIKRDKLKEEE